MNNILKNKVLSFFIVLALIVGILGVASALFDSSNNSSSTSATSSVGKPSSGTSSVTTSNGGSNSGNSNNSDASTNVVDFSGLIYSALGDSITYGADNAKGYAQMNDPYPELVSKNLGAQSYKIYGVSGATVATDVDDLPSICTQAMNVALNSHIISVMGGVNDYNRSVEIGCVDDKSTTTFYGALNYICEILTSTHSTSFIFFMTPYKEYPYHSKTCDTPNRKGYTLEDYANAVKVVCAKYNIPVLDMYNLGNFELEMYDANSDGIHPSQEFVREYTAPQIAAFIKSNYK